MWMCYSDLLLISLWLSLLFTLCSGRVNLTCTKDSDCPVNSSCETGHVCFCNTGYIDEINDSLRCLREATKYGDSCETNIQCHGLLGLKSHCLFQKKEDSFGRCLCTDDAHYKLGICHRNSYIGDKCVVSDDCLIRSREIQSYCDRGKCICPPKHIPSPDKKDCIPIAGLGEKCENVTCIIPNSKCEVYCQCKMGYVTSKDNKECLKAADTLNDPCVDDSQCTEFLKLSKCDLNVGKCACQNFTHRLHDQCWLTVELLGLCEYDSECYVSGDRNGVVCKRGSCICKEGYQMAGTSCVPIISEAKFGLGSNSNKNILHLLLHPLIIGLIYVKLT